MALSKGKAQLVKVLRVAGDVVRVADVVEALGLPRREAAKRLSRWMAQGWVRRVGRGAYISVALADLGSEQVLDDPWILVPALFAPGYIGGRTAAEHWDLTEQLFKDIVVITAQPLRQRRQIKHGAIFTLKHVSEERLFGTKTIWRHRSRVLVSDVYRTVVDLLDEPALGGGIQQVVDCVNVYFSRKDRDDDVLLRYAEQLGNGAVFKRLGFIAERTGTAPWLVEGCLSRLTAGNAKLDPGIDCPLLVTRWRLLIPNSWAEAKRA